MPSRSTNLLASKPPIAASNTSIKSANVTSTKKSSEKSGAAKVDPSTLPPLPGQESDNEDGPAAQIQASLKRKSASDEPATDGTKESRRQKKARKLAARAADGKADGASTAKPKEEPLNEDIARMDGQLMADYFARQIKRFEPDLGVDELEDRRVAGMVPSCSCQNLNSRVAYEANSERIHRHERLHRGKDTCFAADLSRAVQRTKPQTALRGAQAQRHTTHDSGCGVRYTSSRPHSCIACVPDQGCHDCEAVCKAYQAEGSGGVGEEVKVSRMICVIRVRFASSAVGNESRKLRMRRCTALQVRLALVAMCHEGDVL